MTITLHQADVLAALRELPDASFDAALFDPPYGLGNRQPTAEEIISYLVGADLEMGGDFMGKDWQVPSVAVWKELLRVLKPGAPVLAFGGTRVFDLITIGMRMAGLEIRDAMCWLYGKGFPKSLSISKALDKTEHDRCSQMAIKARSADQVQLVDSFLEYITRVPSVGVRLVEGESSALEPVSPQNSLERSPADARCAESVSDAALLTPEEIVSSALARAVATTSASSDHAKPVDGSQENHAVSSTAVSSVLGPAPVWPNENQKNKLKAVVALRTWLGSERSSKAEATNVLCAALADDWKLITSNPSEPTQSSGTIRKTGNASATIATITASTAACLISFMVDTLEHEYLDAAAGAERPVIGSQTLTGNAAVSLKDKGGTYGVQVGTVAPKTVNVTGPATDLAKDWDGFGSALKPGWEPVVLARRPLEGTVVANVTKWGVGALNIDGCRLHRDTDDVSGYSKVQAHGPNVAMSGKNYPREPKPDAEGRWPANVALSHTADCREIGTREVATGTAVKRRGVTHGGPVLPGAMGTYAPGTPDAGYGQGGKETVTAWDCSPECPVRMLDEHAGERPSTLTGRADPGQRHINPGDNGGASTFGGGNSSVYADSGGPSRFFYSSKVSTEERELGCEGLPLRSAGEATDREDGSDGLESPRAGAGRTGGARNVHPTLKPIALARWLATLLLPPARRDGRPRRILVCYAGAGSEVIGASRAGWDEVVGIERDAEYVTIARARIARWEQVPREMPEGEVLRTNEKADPRQIGLFGGPR